jgi:hypothetical protein
MWACGRALARGWTIVSVGLMLGGCAPFLPGFEGILGAHSWIHRVPVSAVATTVQCELKAFLAKPAHQSILDKEQAATVQLLLQSDNGGGVTYVGIDLDRLGLKSVTELIALQNKVPNLQAGLQGKSVVSSQVEFNVPQTIGRVTIPPKWGIDPDTGDKRRSPAVTIEGLERVSCGDNSKRLPLPLDLDKWLERFFENLAAHHDNTDAACMTKVTLKTQFQLVVAIKGGANPLFGSAFILPISGLNFEFSPVFTHSLQIAFALKRHKQEALCTKIPSTQPSVRI